MGFQTSTGSDPRRAAHGALLALAVALLAGAAEPARADGDFENAFERQLGRILAFEAVAVGKALLYGAAPYPAPAYYPTPAYYPAPVAVAQPVPVAVPVPVPYYAAPVARPVVYYGGGHHHWKHHGHGYRGWHGGRGHRDRD